MQESVGNGTVVGFDRCFPRGKVATAFLRRDAYGPS